MLSQKLLSILPPGHPKIEEISIPTLVNSYFETPPEEDNNIPLFTDTVRIKLYINEYRAKHATLIN